MIEKNTHKNLCRNEDDYGSKKIRIWSYASPPVKSTG